MGKAREKETSQEAIVFNQERKCGNFSQVSGSRNRIQGKDMRIAINKAWSTRVGSQDICRKAENELDMLAHRIFVEKQKMSQTWNSNLNLVRK